MKKKFFVIDGHHLMYRAFFAMQNMKRSDGFPTGAIFGVSSMLFNIIEKEQPDYLAFTFDFFKSFRHEKAEDYKATRKETPEDLKIQREIVYETVRKMGIPIFAVDGFEADDVMGTIAELNLKEENLTTYLVTGDMDAMQLVVDDQTLVAYPHKGYRDPLYYNEEKVYEKYGLTPSQVICFKCIAGDSSDNIKGIEGIGEVGAKKLLQEFGSLDGVYQNLDKIKGALKKKLEDGHSYLDHLVDMTTIRRDVALPDYSLELCEFKGLSFEVENLFKEYECHSLVRRLHKLHSDKTLVDESQMSLF